MNDSHDPSISSTMYTPFSVPQMLSQLFLSLNVDAKVKSNPVKTYSQIKNKSRVFFIVNVILFSLKETVIGGAHISDPQVAITTKTTTTMYLLKEI